MVKRLTLKDINKLLNYYKINSKRLTKRQKLTKLHNILAKKLCNCIHKVNKNKTISTPICRNSIFTKKKINFYKFACKKRPKLLLPKNKTHKVFKL